MSNEEALISVEIITPSTHETLSVLWIELEAPNGIFMVMHGHAPLVSVVKRRGIINLGMLSGKPRSIESSGGIFSIADNHAQLILSPGA